MSQIVKLRRSSVSGQKPTNSNLQLGELAINTTDGKVYMSKSGSIGPSIEELISTNAFNTGSVNISGSITLIGQEIITGCLVVTDGVGIINKGLISENSDLVLTSGSNIYVENGGIISGSEIWGDGSHLINIPSSGVTGLELNKIISGSSEAVISPSGLNINTNVSITGSLNVTSITGSIDWSNIINGPINEGSIGGFSTLYQTTDQSTWSFQHNIGQRYPIFQVFNNNGNVIIPTQIKTIDENNSEILFATPQRGVVVASLGGGNGSVQQFMSSSLWVVTHNLGTEFPNVTVWDQDKIIIVPDSIESINTNQLEISFNTPTSGYVSVARGGHIFSDSMVWDYIVNKPEGIVSGSEQLTGSYDTRYVLSGSITQTTWDNIANKPVGIISGSIQVDITGTTGYSAFSSSIATTDLTQNNRLDSLETESGSIRSNFNSFTSSYTTVSSSLDNRLDILEAYSGSQLVPSASMSFRTLQTDVYCKNMTGTQINKGTVVRIVGATGDNPLIGIADSTTEHASSNTLGITTENIPNDSFGLVITEGTLVGVNTDGMTAGALLYLGTNGTFTTIPTVAPNHEVRLGEVLRVQQNQGSIYVRIDNGIELNEAHDVIYTGITHGDLLIRSGSVWKNGKSLEGDYVVTGSLLVSGSVVISGSLDLSNANIGSSRYLHTQQTSSVTWNITHNLGYSYPNVTVYDGSTNKIMIPSDITSIDQNTTQVTFATSEYGFALVSVGGISAGASDRYLHTQNTSTGSWVIDHNLDYKFPNIDVYDSNDEQLIPQKVKAVSENRIQIDFVTPTSGNVIISTGGQRSTSLFNDNGSYYSTDNDIVITGSLVVTGDVDAANFNTTSDKKIKTNLEKVENALEKIEKINGYTFNWLESYNENQTRQIGMLANEVYDVQPELTTERKILINGNEETILLLDYSKVTALLIEAVKELNEKVIKLENKKKKK